MNRLATVSLLFALAAVLLGDAYASVETYANFLTDDEIQYFKSIPTDVEEKAPARQDPARSRGAAVLDTSISKRLHKITGTHVTPEEQNEYSRSIAVTKLTGTTETHVDYHYFTGEKAEDKVAFIFLETNPDATFVHGEAKIPSEAGKLVVFDGGVPHNTQVERGTLALAGPLDLRRLSLVSDAPTMAPTKTPKSRPKAPKSSKAPSSKAPKSSKAPGTKSPKSSKAPGEYSTKSPKSPKQTKGPKSAPTPAP